MGHKETEARETDFKVDDTLRYLSAIEGSKEPYFPPLYQKPDCACCEKRKDCWSYDKFQRDRRDFSYMSGRCPRLPDMRGFVEGEERELYQRTFPLIHAERGGCEGEYTLTLHISLPGEKRFKKVYRTYGYWWFRDKSDRRVIWIDSCLTNPEAILKKMRRADYYIFPCRIDNDSFL